MKHKPTTVKDLIKIFSNLPQDAVVYMRPKYSGPLDYYEDAEVVGHQIHLMNPKESLSKNLTEEEKKKALNRRNAKRFGKDVKMRLNKKGECVTILF